MLDVLNDAGNIKANGTLTVSGNTSLDGGTFVNYNISNSDTSPLSSGSLGLQRLDSGEDLNAIVLPAI